MTTATEFYRRTVLDDTHVIAVFLTKERHGTHRFRFGDRRMTTLLQMDILTDELVSQYLHFAEFFRRHFLEVREVKTQAVGRHETTLLLYMFAQHFTQRVMKDVRCRVVTSDGLTTFCIYSSDEFAVQVSRQFRQNMYRQSVLSLGINNFELCIVNC